VPPSFAGPTSFDVPARTCKPKVQKLLVGVSVAWSADAMFVSAKSVPPLASLPKLAASLKSK